MATYFQRDIETDDEGEISIERGDFKVATSERTALQMANWVVLTDFADYTPVATFGANLSDYIGYPNVGRTHMLMRQSIREAFRDQGEYDVSDVRVAVEPIDINEVGVFVQLIGDFFLLPGETSLGQVLLAFRYPFPNGELVKADLGVS